MKNIFKFSILFVIILMISSGVYAQPLVSFSIQNRSVSGTVYYADLYASVSSNCNGWGVMTNTILIQYNGLGLSVGTFDGQSLLNLDPELSAGGISVTETDFDDNVLAVSVFGMTNVIKNGTFRIGTFRYQIIDGTLNDNLSFLTSNSNFEVFNYGDLMTLCNSGCYCYTISNPQTQTIIPPISISTLPLAYTFYCQGSTLEVPYSVSGGTMNSGNIFTVQLSDGSGSFATPLTIGSLATTATTGTISCNLPPTIPYGIGYRVRVVSSNPSVIGTDNGSDFVIDYYKSLTLILGMHGLWNTNTSIHQFAMVWVELRTGVSLMTSVLFLKEAAYLNSVGELTLNLCIPSGSYYIVVRANGYMPIAIPSSIFISSIYSWDFTTASTQSVGGDNAMIQPNNQGRWLMRAGDFNNTRSVTASDANIFLLNNGRNISSFIPAP